MTQEEKKDFPVKPIFLFADSQILFWQGGEGLVLERIKETIYSQKSSKQKIKAAYIGASNGDEEDFYDIFLAAVAQVGISPKDCMMIKSKPSEAEKDFLTEADLILLAGGDVKLGWDVMTENGVREAIVECYHNGAVLIGISAGAVQLGIRGFSETGERKVEDMFTTFQLVPFVIDVHDDSQWERLSEAVKNGDDHCRGFGIPSGGGAVFHPDWSMEAIRHPLAEYSLFPEGLKNSMVFPPEAGKEEEYNQVTNKEN